MEHSLHLEQETIGKFIDASVDDHAEAKRLLGAYPELRQANWMGDEHLFVFLVIENFPAGVSFCLQHGFDANQIDGEMGTTPLHYACKLNYLAVAKILSRQGQTQTQSPRLTTLLFIVLFKTEMRN